MNSLKSSLVVMEPTVKNKYNVSFIIKSLVEILNVCRSL